jgi:hypothetical protein
MIRMQIERISAGKEGRDLTDRIAPPEQRATLGRTHETGRRHRRINL